MAACNYYQSEEKKNNKKKVRKGGEKRQERSSGEKSEEQSMSSIGAILKHSFKWLLHWSDNKPYQIKRSQAKLPSR